MNKTLANIPGYYGQVDDVGISLWRGAYQLNGLYLNKVDAETQVPFLNFPATDISIQWRALLKGKVVSEIEMDNPEIIYVFEDQESTPEGGEADVDDWTKALTDIVPLEINEFVIRNGKFAFVQLSADPNIDLAIENVQLTASNLRNVVEKERILPSPITATGVSFGGGQVRLDGNLNLVKEVPDMDIAFALENSDAQALNDFTEYYAGIDFERGTFELFSEMAIADGYLKGYMKPLLTDSKLIGPEDGFIETLWEGFVGFFGFILENQGTDTFATEIPLEGDLNNVEAGVWPALGAIVQNAWIEAFKGKTDDSIEFEDAFNEGDDLSKKEQRQQRREERKEERQERREQRKREREQRKAEKEAE